MLGTPVSKILVLTICFLLSGCQAVLLSALGVGASTGVSHTLGGITYRTFTEPLPRVRTASLKALQRMQIKVEAAETVDGVEGLRGLTGDRQIEIEFESVSPSTTRMRVVAKKSAFSYDSATAVEIIIQTEKFL